MKRYCSLLLLMFCLLSCRKNADDALTPARLLMSHSWYPYQSEYQTVDSSFVYPADNPYYGTPTVSVSHSDSTALLSGCGQQTVYNFEDNAVLHVTNTCSNVPADVTTTWQLSQTNQMSMYLATLGFGGTLSYSIAYGLITNLTPDSFVFSTPSFMSFYYSSGQANTVHHIYYQQLTTFKRR